MNAGSNGTVLVVSDDAAQTEKARAALRLRPVLLRVRCRGAGSAQTCSGAIDPRCGAIVILMSRR